MKRQSTSSSGARLGGVWGRDAMDEVEREFESDKGCEGTEQSKRTWLRISPRNSKRRKPQAFYSLWNLGCDGWKEEKREASQDEGEWEDFKERVLRTEFWAVQQTNQWTLQLPTG